MAISNIVVSAVLGFLAAIISPVSQATLAPVYGGINAAVNHQQAIIGASIVGYVLGWTTGWPTQGRGLRILAVWMFWMPVIEDIQFRYSISMGPIGGPIVSGLTSCHSILIPSMYIAAVSLKTAHLEKSLGSALSLILPTAITLTVYQPLENFLSNAISSMAVLVSTNEVSGFGPVNMQVYMALVYLGLALYRSPASKWRQYLLIVPAFFHTLNMNYHLDSPIALTRLQRSLAKESWSILERKWSNTGYLSVLENENLGYRVLRCDHSLLGGEWLLTTERKSQGWTITEPVYSVFVMLEAARLMKVSPRIKDEDANALIIGMGVGTAPKSFIAHGIDTTVVELDPVVHALATKYFELPTNHTAVLQDAITWVDEESSSKSKTYDYILHDVFTGGAEPLALFNYEFITNLRSLLKPNGVAAINYAGDLALPLTNRILNTITHAFDGQCKIYRDGAPPVKAGDDEDEGDFVNMVVFCRNTAGPISFRQPVLADFLGSGTRQRHLLPQAEHDIVLLARGEEEILRRGQEGEWNRQQAESAMRHWRIMRTVLPDRVWEMW